MKGFKDSSGKFHPMTDSKGVRKSRDQSAKSTGVKVVRNKREGKKGALLDEYLHSTLTSVRQEDGIKYLISHGVPKQDAIDYVRVELKGYPLARIGEGYGSGERKAREGEDQSYWGQNGKYQKEADVLQKLVPAEGVSPDRNVDLFRRASNLYYEIFNNGGGNLEGEGNDIEVRRFESEGFDLPIVNLLIEEQNKVDENYEMIGDTDKYFEGAQDEMDRLMDQVIEQIMESRKHA